MKLLLKTVFSGAIIILVSGFYSDLTTQSLASNNSTINKSTDTNRPFNESVNHIAFNLYKSECKGNNNIIFSPFSITAAIAMAYTGASGSTGDEISKVFLFNNRQDEATQYKLFSDSLLNSFNSKELQLQMANSMWLQMNYTILPGFINIIDSFYHAHIAVVDYIDESSREKARIDMNQWVEQKTNNKIKDLIQPGILNNLTRLVLTNAIYFNGKWEIAFDKNQTTESDFYPLTKEKLKVPMMQQTSKFGYYENESIQAINLPYESGRLSMIILLPKEAAEFSKIEEKLTYNLFIDWIEQFNKKTVQVFLPKYKTQGNFELDKTLSDLGMPTAFSNNADFSALNGKKDLMIDKVIHQAFIDVGEEGTEAAAATSVVIGLKSLNIEKTKVFRADHPFIYFIYDNSTRTILFMGRIINPIE